MFDDLLTLIEVAAVALFPYMSSALTTITAEGGVATINALKTLF
jgi:hypothetical protein